MPRILLLLLGLAWTAGSPGLAGQVGAAGLGAQDTSATEGEVAPEPRLAGELRLAGVPADSGTVVLHRVTPEESGAIDSVRVDSAGRFSLELPGLPQPGSGEVYFASARREGILYFGSPITGATPLDSSYVVDVYDTEPAPEGGLPLPIAIRNIFIDEGPMGWRVTDVFEVRNDSSVTWVPGTDDRPVWRYPLPKEARSPRAVQAELGEDALRFPDGGFALHTHVPPGAGLYVVQYDLESIDFSLPLPGRTDTLEVLVREPAPSLRMRGLTAVQPAELQPGVRYLRWRGTSLSDRVVRVEQGSESGVELLPWFAAGLAVLLLGAGFWLTAARRDPAEVPTGTRPPPPARDRRRRMLEVARLDEAFSAKNEPSPEEVERYRQKRRVLIEGARGGEEEQAP